MNPLFSSLQSDAHNPSSASNAAPVNAQLFDANQAITLQVAQLEAMPSDSAGFASDTDTDTSSDKNVDTQTFVPFSAAPFWQQQLEYYQQMGPKLWQQDLISNKLVQSSVAQSPAMVNSYCQILVKYLLDGLYNGAINSNQPVYLLELGAGCGRFAILVLKRLESLLIEYGLDDLKLCYLISDSSEKNRQFIKQHPYLQPFLNAGKARVIDADSCFFSANGCENSSENKETDSETADIIDYRSFEPASPYSNELVDDKTENYADESNTAESNAVENNAAENNQTENNKPEEQPENTNSKNPLIVIANHFFSRLPQTLFYLHYGQLYLAELVVNSISDENINTDPQRKEPEKTEPEQTAPEQPDSTNPWHYRWNKITNLDDWLVQQNESVQPLLKQQLIDYSAQLFHQPLLIPTAAIASLTKLQQQHPQGLMLLTADFGPTELSALQRNQLSTNKVNNLPLNSSINNTEQRTVVDLRELALPTTNHNKQIFWPVDFLTLQQWAVQEIAGSQSTGLSRTIKHQQNGVAFNVSIIDPKQRDFTMFMQATEQYLVNQNPADNSVTNKCLQGAVNVLTEEQILSYLRSSSYDPQLLELFLPRLLKQGVKINARLIWCDVLTQVWQNYVPIAERCESDEFSFKLGLLAIDLSHWSLAKVCFFSCLHWYGESTAICHNLALICFACGDEELALTIAELTLTLSPDDSRVNLLSDDISGYKKYCEELKWFSSDNDSVQNGSTQKDGVLPETDLNLSKMLLALKPLILKPLDMHHVGEFCLQYRDPNIAALSRGYILNTSTQVETAIQRWQADKQRASYAVVHQELGFVGCTSLELWKELIPELQQASEQEPEQDRNTEKQLQSLIPDTSHKQAYFSFWTGTDYQNMGFGQQAALLCIEQAKAMATQGLLDYLVTSVWSFNTCSVHVLEKVGFELLDFVCAKDPELDGKEGQGFEQEEHQELFYCMSLVGELDEEVKGRICAQIRLNRDG